MSVLTLSTCVNANPGSAASGVVPVILQKLYHADIVLNSGTTSSIIPIDLLWWMALKLSLYNWRRLQMNHGPVNIRRVRFFVLPGESREILLGVPEQQRLGLPRFEELLEEMARRTSMHKMNRGAPAV
jgi:hypothetical protein